MKKIFSLVILLFICLFAVLPGAAPAQAATPTSTPTPIVIPSSVLELLGINTIAPPTAKTYPAYNYWVGSGKYFFKAAGFTTPYLTTQTMMDDWNHILYKQARVDRGTTRPVSAEIQALTDAQRAAIKAGNYSCVTPMPTPTATPTPIAMTTPTPTLIISYIPPAVGNPIMTAGTLIANGCGYDPAQKTVNLAMLDLKRNEYGTFSDAMNCQAGHDAIEIKLDGTIKYSPPGGFVLGGSGYTIVITYPNGQQAIKTQMAMPLIKFIEAGLPANLSNLPGGTVVSVPTNKQNQIPLLSTEAPSTVPTQIIITQNECVFLLPATNPTPTPTSPQSVATPIFSIPAGNYTSTQNVSIYCNTSGATIRYTTSGNEPNSSSTVYIGPISVSSTTTIKAKAFKNGLTDSVTASAIYTVTPTVVFQGRQYYIDVNPQGASADIWLRSNPITSSSGDIDALHLDLTSSTLEQAEQIICQAKQYYDAGKTIAGCMATVASGACIVASVPTAGTAGLLCTGAFIYTADTGLGDCISGVKDYIMSELVGDKNWAAVAIQTSAYPQASEAIGYTMDYACASLETTK